jgi:hypothetical protein
MVNLAPSRVHRTLAPGLREGFDGLQGVDQRSFPLLAPKRPQTFQVSTRSVVEIRSPWGRLWQRLQGPAGVRVWQITSEGRRPLAGRSPPERANVAYAHRLDESREPAAGRNCLCEPTNLRIQAHQLLTDRIAGVLLILPRGERGECLVERRLGDLGAEPPCSMAARTASSASTRRTPSEFPAMDASRSTDKRR